MSDETKRVIFWVLGIALFMVFYLIIMAVVGFVKGAAGVESMLDITGWIVIVMFGVGILFAIVLLFARIFISVAQTFIQFQAADDKGEIARVAMNQMGKFDVKVAQVAGRLAQQQASAIVRASNRQLPTVQEPEPEYADYWPLPQLEDNGD